jgi:hypothetical protein
VNVLKPHMQTTIWTLLREGNTQREIERRTGISRHTIRAWAKRFEAQGGPPPQPPDDLNCPLVAASVKVVGQHGGCLERGAVVAVQHGLAGQHGNALGQSRALHQMRGMVGVVRGMPFPANDLAAVAVQDQVQKPRIACRRSSPS